MHHIASRCITLIHACVYVHVLSLKPQNGLTVGKKEVGMEAGGKAKGTHVICLHILHMSVCSSVSTCRPIYLTFYPTDQPISFSVDSLRSWLTNLRNSIACAALVALLKTHPTATMHAHAYMKAYTFWTCFTNAGPRQVGDKCRITGPTAPSAYSRSMQGISIATWHF